MKLLMFKSGIDEVRCIWNRGRDAALRRPDSGERRCPYQTAEQD